MQRPLAGWSRHFSRATFLGGVRAAACPTVEVIQVRQETAQVGKKIAQLRQEIVRTRKSIGKKRNPSAPE